MPASPGRYRRYLADASLLVIPHDTTGYYRRWAALYSRDVDVSQFQQVRGVGAEAVWTKQNGLLARYADGTVIASFNLDLNHNKDRDAGLSHDIALARTLYARLPH